MNSLINKVLCMDYLDLLAQIPDESVDLVLTDPPYGINFVSHMRTVKFKKDTRAGESMRSKNKAVLDVLEGDDKPFSYEPLARETMRILKPDSACFFFTCPSSHGSHYRQVSRAGVALKETLIIQKRLAGMSNLEGSFQSNSEWCLFGHKGRFKFRRAPLVEYASKMNVPGRGEGNFLVQDTSPKKGLNDFKMRLPTCWFGPQFPWSAEHLSTDTGVDHPTRKTVEVMSWLIQLTTDKGGIVVDPFMGSWTTAMAALRTGRRFIGCDKHQGFCDAGVIRIKRARGFTGR